MRQAVHWPGEDGRTLCGLEQVASFTVLDREVTCKECDAGRRYFGDEKPRRR